MTLTSPTVRVQYNGDGNTASFAITYIIWDDDDPTVTHTDSNGIETTWVRGTQYNITLVSPPATATLVVVTSPTDYTPALGEKLTIKSDLANTQPTDLPIGGSFPSPSVEQQLDQTVRQIQQSEETHSRSLQFPVSDSSSLSSEIPASANRASKYLTFDIFGEPTATDGQSASGTSVTPTGSTITRTLADWFADVTILVESVQELAATDFTGFQDNGAIELASYHPLALTSALEGGGTFIWDATGAKSQHDGGIIISPTVPWTWADNGVAYLAGTGETDSGGNGVFVRVTDNELRPEHYGARQGRTINSAPSIHAALDVIFAANTTGFITLNGGGKEYGVASSWTKATGASKGKGIRNLGLFAMNPFTGDHFLKLAGSGASQTLSEWTIDACSFVGGDSGVAARVKKLIDVDNVYRAHVAGNRFRIFSEHGFLSRDTGPAVEILFLDNSVNGQVANNPGTIGIESRGNDIVVERNLINECAVHCLFENSGNTFNGNHIYTFQGSNDVYGLICNEAAGMIINNNYIDGVKVLLVDPSSLTMTGNKFLIQDGDDWTTGTLAFVVFKDSTGSSSIFSLTITGNTFNQVAGTTVAAFGVDETVGVFDYTTLIHVYIKNNTFKTIPIQTSHPTHIFTFASDSLGTIGLNAINPFTGNTVYTFVKSVVFNASSGNTGEIKRAYQAGNQLTVELLAVATGDIVTESTLNSDGQ